MQAHLYLFDGWADWEPAYAVAGLNQPQFQRTPGRWRVHTVAERTGVPVRSLGGVAAQPDLSFDQLDPDASHLLILPGGLGWEDAAAPRGGPHQRAIATAVQWLQRGIPVAAICGATAGLARAGALDHRQHTSNAAAYLQGTGYDGGRHYVEEDAVNDRGLITAGGMAPLAFAREIFEHFEVYAPEVLDAWFALYSTGQSRHYARMRRAALAPQDDRARAA